MTQFRTGDISTSGHGCFLYPGMCALCALCSPVEATSRIVTNINPPKKICYGRSYSSIPRLLPFNLLFVRGKTYWRLDPTENVES